MKYVLIWNTLVLVSPLQENYRHIGASLAESHHGDQVLEHMTDEGRLRDMLQPQEEKGKGRSYCCLQTPNSGCRQEARLFLEVHSGKGNENKLEHGKFLLDTQIF